MFKRVFRNYIESEYKEMILIVKCFLFIKGWIVIKYFRVISSNKCLKEL